MKNKNKKVATIEGLAVMINNGFQNTQDHFDKKFNSLTGEMNKNFSEVKQQIDNINKNIVDVVHQEDFDKLESRMVDVEEVVDLRLKRLKTEKI